MRLAIVAVLAAAAAAACHPTPPPTPPPAPAPAAAAAPPSGPSAPPAAAGHDEATVVARSEAFFRAVDGADATAVDAMLAADFLRVISSRFYSREQTLGPLRARQGQAYPRFSDRSFELAKVRFFGDTAVFTGESTVAVARAADDPPRPLERTESLTWTWQDGAWKLASWDELISGPEAEALLWNETFRTSTMFDLAPNKFLVEAVRGRKPGTALDVGMGQGRNALYLATQGWDVTGIDISDEGIRQALEAARAAKVDLHTEIADHETWDWGEKRWDLIAFLYMGAQPPVDKIRRALKPGGIVVIEFFLTGANAGSGVGAFKPGELRAMFADGFDIVRYEEVEAQADWTRRVVPLARLVAARR
ncbi:MAG TPA: methyltransferase domain-containing protein [Kofleriaceae bacterium]|nr:methyltransferase domain-containing protein [Kofleriaceae bacterium]